MVFLSGSWAQAQVDLDSPERQALQRDITRYQELLQERASELARIEAALGETEQQLQRRLTERDTISAELSGKRREREQIETQLTELEGQRRETEARISDLSGRLSDLEVRVQDLLVSLYKQRGQRTAAGVGSSDSFHDVRVRNRYLGILAEQDADIIRELDGVLSELSAQQARLEQQQADLEQAKAALARAEEELSATQVRLEQVVAELNATQAGQLIQQQALLEEQNRLERSMGDASNQLEREIARLREEETRARAAAAEYVEDRERQLELQRQADQARSRADALSAPLEPNASGFIRPFDDANLISRFGEGNNSYLGIRAPVANAAVRAVQVGRVAAITYLGANFGYMLALQHDNGLVSIYVNLRQPLVELFDTVNQGAVVGYLGGGTLTRNDVLQFYAQRDGAAGSPFIDPAPLLGW